jgi:hypothetical protein
MYHRIVWPGGHTFCAVSDISDDGFYFWSSYYLFYEAASLLTPYKVIYALYRGCVHPNEGKRRTGEHGEHVGLGILYDFSLVEMIQNVYSYVFKAFPV